jgi:hypothetical protein
MPVVWTACPTSAEMWLAPWISAISTAMGAAGQSLAAPGVDGAYAKSTLLTSVSMPSGQRERPFVPSGLWSSPAPDPSVYGAGALPP